MLKFYHKKRKTHKAFAIHPKQKGPQSLKTKMSSDSISPIDLRSDKLVNYTAYLGNTPLS